MGLEHSCSPRSKTSIKNRTVSLNISNRQSCSRTLCSAQLRTALRNNGACCARENASVRFQLRTALRGDNYAGAIKCGGLLLLTVGVWTYWKRCHQQGVTIRQTITSRHVATAWSNRRAWCHQFLAASRCSDPPDTVAPATHWPFFVAPPTMMRAHRGHIRRQTWLAALCGVFETISLSNISNSS